ncbi:MAG: SEC-C domain-containing protein, partial [Rhodospirillales bacterium]
FEIRKQLLKFDDVMNDQRKEIFEQRKELMRVDDVHEDIVAMRHDTVEVIVGRCIPSHAYSDDWQVDSLHEECLRVFGLDLPVADWAKEEGIADQEIIERITRAIDAKMAEKAATYGPDLMRYAEKTLLLQILDQSWKEHLLQLDHLRQGIGLRAYGQRDPLNEYKQEAFALFQDLLVSLRESVTQYLAHIQVRSEAQEQELAAQRAPALARAQETRADPAFAEAQPQRAAAGGGMPVQTRARAAGGLDPNNPASWGKVQRNAPCPCGSGRKYKHCHGKVA